MIIIIITIVTEERYIDGREYVNMDLQRMIINTETVIS